MVVRKTIKRHVYLLVFMVLVSGLYGCYSFTGASVPPHLKTIAIPLFDDQSGTGEPNIREQLTNKLQEIFIQDANFQLTDRKSADAILEGTITAMSNEPSVLGQKAIVTKNRKTINVKVIYRDQKFKKQIWERQFSRYADFDISGGPSALQEAITTALNQLTEDILLETVSGW